jgi:NADP-dependent 3-hydroxy acid dehydrogenase YdfG
VFRSLEEFSYEQIRALVDLNLVSQIFVARAVLPLMKRRGNGDLIFIGSEAGLVGGRHGAVYAATKSALRGLARSLRQECASGDIRVCIVNPGMVKTEFFSKLDFEPGEDSSNYILPQDVAAIVVNLLELRQGTVIDEINLTPQKKVMRRRKRQRAEDT